MTTKGFFRPLHPEKYDGDPTNIVFRSSWEFRFYRSLDNDPRVRRWSSEEIVIPYRSPRDGRIHRYFPDAYFEKSDGSKHLVEIKPRDQCVPPRKRSKITKKYLAECICYGVNMAKWEAAKAYAERRGWKFAIFTERELGLEKGTKAVI